MKYIVAVIGLSLLNNKVAAANDIVEDSQLANPEKLLKEGFIRKASKADIEKARLKENPEEVIEAPAPADVKPYDKWVKADLHAELTKRDILFTDEQFNADLVKLLEDDDNKGE